MKKINEPTYSFKTAREWKSCLNVKGTKRIVVGDSGKIDHIITARDRMIWWGHGLEDWLKKHPQVNEQVAKWCIARDEAVNTWKHETPHARYECDGGTLAVLVNGVKLQIGNRVGDGDFPVYILVDDGKFDGDEPHTQTMPHTFRSTGTNLCDCTLQILNYDCGGGKPMAVPVYNGKDNPTMTEIRVKNAWFYRDGRGAVAIVCHMA